MSFTQSDLITMLHQVNNPMLYTEYINLCFFYSVLSYASPCELSLASPKVNYPMHASPNELSYVPKNKLSCASSSDYSYASTTKFKLFYAPFNCFHA